MTSMQNIAMLLNGTSLDDDRVVARSTTQRRFKYDGNGLIPINQSDEGPLDKLLRHYAIKNTTGRFWTQDLLRHILTRDRVQKELKRKEYGWTEADVRYFVNLICSQSRNSARVNVSYLKIFALLLLSNHVGDLQNFIMDGFSDEKLPLKFDMVEADYLESSQNEGTRLEDLNCFQNWQDQEIEYFENSQWGFTAPFFDLAENNICKEFYLHSQTVPPWRKLSGSSDVSGGYAIVQQVEFHPTSHSFDKVLRQIHLGNRLAIKTLHTAPHNDEQQFRREFEHLKRFSGFIHPHIVTTLGAFKRGDQWSLIFPKAHGDLSDYFKKMPPEWNHTTVLWASRQLCGMMGALDAIHDPKHLHVGGNREKKYGRHGDIKCDNILCFQEVESPDQFILVIADFGLSSLNRDTSRSNIPNEKIPGVPGYRPPECDIKGGLISRAYDIWTIGCLFLDFMTWLMGGPNLLTEFEDQRTTMYINGISNDIFFTLKTIRDKSDGAYVAQVKPEVTRWIQRLKSEKNCSRFVRDVLNLIETEMLVVLEKKTQRQANRQLSPGQRSSSGRLKAELESYKARCRNERGYATRGIPERYRDPRLAPGVEADLNDFAIKMIKQQNPRFQDFEGERGLSMRPDEFEELVGEELVI